METALLQISLGSHSINISIYYIIFSKS